MAARPLRTAWPVRAAAVAALAVGAGSLTLLPGGSPTAAAAGLVPWADCDALVAHYREQLERQATPWGGGVIAYAEDTSGGAMAAAEGAPVPAAARTGGAVGTGPTGTNLQEAGVDEPDTVKLSGDLVLASAAGRLQVLRGGRSPELLSTVEVGDGASWPAELLVDGDRVLVLTTSWRPAPGQPEPGPVPEPEPVPEPVPVPEPLPVEPLPVEPPGLPTEPGPPP
ncbi:MAG TPA: beta-propeller domain-containing protein, partial [Mycobacteriales bacterium]|nr:beta-propeller domain-containing protein [Mycobacteriales bacterium]